jgi:peptide/nickel transport system substrate-binding protein
MAINRPEIIRAVLGGYGTVAATTVPPYHWAYDSRAVPPLPFDPDSARALLTRAGWVDRNGDGVRENASGLKMTLDIKTNQGSRQRNAILQIIQAELKDVGVQVRPDIVDAATIMDQITSEKRDFDGVLMSWVSDFKLDDRDLFLSSRSDGAFALSGTHDPKLDRLLDTLQLVVDRGKAKPLWIDYERELQKDEPYTFLYYVKRIVGMRRALHGTDMDARGEWVNVRHWWLDPAARGDG